MADLPELDLSPLREVATERLHNALAKINGTDGVELKQGLDELTALTKRSDDTSDALDVVLQTGLLRRLLAFLQPDFLTQFPGQQVPVKGVSAEPLLLPLGEAVQIATLAALSELIWQRDTASEVRPALQNAGGLATLGNLIANTSSERIRLKALVLTRRLMYEVGSTSVMDDSALQAAHDCDMLGSIVSLLPRVVDEEDQGVTMDTLEAVTYLLQRMQVCLRPEQKDLLDLAAVLRSCASTCVSLLRTGVKRRALDVALLAVRELAWDDHNVPVEPGITCMAEAGVFDAIAALLAPPPPAAARPSYDGTGAPTEPSPLLAAVIAGAVSKGVADMACAMLERLAAAQEGTLPASLAAQVPRLLHQVIAQLVDQLDHSVHAPDRQEAALTALRKLLVTEHSEDIPPAAAEAAEAEGVPARLRAVALSGAAFGGPGDENGAEGAPAGTASAAAALLADLTVSSALSAALGGRPAQAAEALTEVEDVISHLIAGLDHDVEACRTFCQALYALSLVRYDEPADTDSEERGGTPRPAPPEEEQYALSSQLVTMVGKVATGLNTLLLGERAKGSSKPGLRGHLSSSSPNTPTRLSGPLPSIGGEQVPAPAAEPEPERPSVIAERLLQRLQRATILMHALAGLRPQVGLIPISRHNIDALFVHGVFQNLVQQLDAYYVLQRAIHKALKHAKGAGGEEEEGGSTSANGTTAAAAAAALAAAEAEAAAAAAAARAAQFAPPVINANGFAQPRVLELQTSFMLPPLSPSRHNSFAQLQNPILHPLLHHETGVLELLKELVRDCDVARLRLRDIGALHTFARMLNDNVRDNLLVSLQFNLARSEELHAALKQEGCVSLMTKVLGQAPQTDGAQHEVRRLLALLTLGLVASDDMSIDADVGTKKSLALLDEHDLPGMMERVMREACRDGRFVISSSTSAWPFMLEPAALSVQGLARSTAMARRLAEKKIPAMLLSALRNKHGSQPDVSLRLVRALLNFARLPDLGPGLLAAGSVDTLQPYTAVEDMRVADAARGCLLLLGELPDMAAKLALKSSLPEAVAPIMSIPLPREPEAGSPAAEPLVDALICYKRLDAHSFARSLHTLLVLRGISCLLDYEYKSDLSDVVQVVGRCRNVVLILSDNALNSPRVLAELEAAVKSDVNVVVVVKEGARWGDSSGNMLGFPPQQTIKALKPDVQKVFSLKPIQHRDEHYAYFVAQLMKRIKTAPRPITPPVSTSPLLTMMRAPSMRAPAAVPLRADGLPALPSSDGSLTGVPIARPVSSHAGARTSAPVPPLSPMSAGIDPALLERALASAMSQQLTLLTDLQDEVISLKSAITQHSPHLTGVPGETQNQQAGSTGDTAAVQAAVQSLSADVASLRREMAEEVAASAKQVSSTLSSEVSALAQQVKSLSAQQSEGGKAAAASSTTSGSSDTASLLASMKAELMSSLSAQVSSLKSELKAEVQAEMGMQLRGVAADILELRRGMTMLVDGLQGMQGMVKSLMLMRGESGLGMNGPGGIRPAPSVLTAMHPDGATFHSSPIAPDMNGDSPHALSASMPTLPSMLAANGGGSMLPPIANGYNGTLHSSGGSGVVRAQQVAHHHTSPARISTNGPVGYGLGPPAATPNVAGFQGARIAAQQARLNTLNRGSKH